LTYHLKTAPLSHERGSKGYRDRRTVRIPDPDPDRCMCVCVKGGGKSVRLLGHRDQLVGVGHSPSPRFYPPTAARRGLDRLADLIAEFPAIAASSRASAPSPISPN